MDFNQLSLFVLLAQCGQFSETSIRGNVSQSSLSKQIKALEDEVGARLFNRSSKGAFPTAAGQEFLNFASSVLEAKRQMHRTISAHLDAENKESTIGIMPVMASYGIAELIAEFREEFPQFNLKIVEKNTREIADLLAQNKFNIALIGTGIADIEKYDEYLLARDEIVLAVSESHPLAKAPEIDISALADERFIFLENSIGLNKIIADGFSDAGIQPKYSYTCDTVPSALSLVKEGLGVLLLTTKGMSIFATNGISLVPLRQKMYGKLVLVTSKEHALNPVDSAFHRFTLDWYNVVI